MNRLKEALCGVVFQVQLLSAGEDFGGFSFRWQRQTWRLLASQASRIPAKKHAPYYA